MCSGAFSEQVDPVIYVGGGGGGAGSGGLTTNESVTLDHTGASHGPGGAARPHVSFF